MRRYYRPAGPTFNSRPDRQFRRRPTALIGLKETGQTLAVAALVPGRRLSPVPLARGRIRRGKAAGDFDAGLGHHPRRGAPVRPGRGVHDERMTQVHIASTTGGLGGAPTQHRRPLPLLTEHAIPRPTRVAVTASTHGASAAQHTNDARQCYLDRNGSLGWNPVPCSSPAGQQLPQSNSVGRVGSRW
jgi:hypothetical protein